MLPPYFEWEDYASCIENSHEYCKVQGTLQVPSSNATLSKFYEERKNNHDVLDPSIIYRAICVNKQEIIQQNTTIVDFISSRINKKLEKYYVSSLVDNYVCTDGKAHINNFDNFILIGVILYTLLILYASYCDKKASSKDAKSALYHFSLYRSWKIKTDISRIKLLHLNSFRFYMMLFVILIHLFVQLQAVYVENPNYLGDTFFTHPYTIYHRKLFTVVVLGFFMVSSWLATVRIYKIVEEHGELSLKHVGIISINRYFRYIAAPIFVILCTSNWKYLFSSQVNFDILIQSDGNCKNNWLSSMLCYSNFYLVGDICYKHTWYISADFQMYIINLLLHYMMFKTKMNIIRTYCLFFLGLCCSHGLILYWYGEGTGYTPTTRSWATYYFQKSLSFLISYLSTFAIASSSFVGVILGYTYYIHKGKTFSPSYLILWLWRTLGIALPVLALHLSTAEGTGLYEAILGSITRPMITLGAGIVLLGMSFNLGGSFRKLLENKYTVILGNFSFSVYITHFIFCQFLHVSVPPKLSLFVIGMDYFKTLAISIAVGIVFSLTVEEPCASLQTHILPQVKKPERATD